MNRYKFVFFAFLNIIICGLVVHSLQLWHDYYFPPHEEILGEMMYFPSGRFLKIAVCDFDMLVANLVWLRAIQYYGRHSLTDYHYPWLAHIFDILFVLDPRFINGLRFGGVLISEDGAKPQEAIKLLIKVVMSNPERWEPIYDIGFINYTIVKNYHEAGKYFQLALLYEGPTGRSIRFAAHSFRKAKEYRLAKNLWRKVMETALTEKRKETALRSIRYIQIDEHIELLQTKVSEYRKKFGIAPEKFDDLIKARLTKEIPIEPFGRKYVLQNNGIVTSLTLLYDELELIIRFLNHRITVYRVAKGRFPEKLVDLVKSGFVSEIPENPLGIKYDYDNLKGKIILPINFFDSQE